MKYTEQFKNEVTECYSTEFYIGTGNPNSQILIVGKEVAIDTENKANREEPHVKHQVESLQDFKANAHKWNTNIKEQTTVDILPDWTGGKGSPLTSNPLFPYKSVSIKEKSEGHTWRKYQKLHNFIFYNDKPLDREKPFDFHHDFFLTEMNDTPAKFTKDADKNGIPSRKQHFQKSDFFQSFSVVILACSNYIIGEEIEEIFKVSFKKQHGEGKQLFWTHYNLNRTKLVIHTRQLSTNVSNDLLKAIATEIRTFLNAKKASAD